MNRWLLRGVVFATAMIVVRLFQAVLINASPQNAMLFSSVLVLAFAIAVFIWAYFDGHRDARSNPDPDRRRDLAMTWLLAGLFAGVVSGAVCWIIGLFYKSIYVGALLNELTTFAAFTALVVFVAGVAGVTLGRWLVDRKTPSVQRHRHAGEADHADTDVFAAVSTNGATDGTQTQRVDYPDQPDQPRQ